MIVIGEILHVIGAPGAEMRGRSLSAELRSELREAEIEGRLLGFSEEGLLGMVAGTAGDGSESPQGALNPLKGSFN